MVKKVNNIKTADTSNLVEKADHAKKFGEIEKKITDHDCSNKHITTKEFNRLTADNFADRIKQANLVSKNDIANFVFLKIHLHQTIVLLQSELLVIHYQKRNLMGTV